VTQPRVRLLILKVAERCNLACTYCYMYFKGDESWRDRPAIMPRATFRDTLGWMRRESIGSVETPVTLLFHGGEPLLIGPARFDAWCREATAQFGATAVTFAIQTNGVLIDDRWIEVFRRHQVSVGVSLDGPPRVHDAYRVDHGGRGSYGRVLAGIRRLQAAEIPWSGLSVINLDYDPLAIHRHLLDEIGLTCLDYILPDQTHDTIGAVRTRYGPTPVADWLMAVFDDWWSRDSIRIRVRILDAIVASLLRSRSHSVQFGNPAFGYLVVEADGSIQALDVLRICQPGLAETGVSVRAETPVEAALPEFHRRAVFEGFPLPTGCHGCREADTCAGGWLPHRYSREREFDNPSAWCADLLKLFGHVRSRLGLAEARPSASLAAVADRPSPR
jgi:uncharacterized protein